MPKTMKATYNGEEIVVTFYGDAVRNDYGVPGSPVWHEPDNIEIASLEICGVDVADPDRRLPPDALGAIMMLADECEWEEVE